MYLLEILKTGDVVQVRILGASLSRFALSIDAIADNIQKIYLMNNRLVITLHASGASHNLMKWLQISDSFITSLPEAIVAGTLKLNSGISTIDSIDASTITKIKNLAITNTYATVSIDATTSNRIVTYGNIFHVLFKSKIVAINDNTDGIRTKLDTIPNKGSFNFSDIIDISRVTTDKLAFIFTGIIYASMILPLKSKP